MPAPVSGFSSGGWAGWSFFVRKDWRAPKPPASLGVILDWDPGYSLRGCREGPCTFEPVGTAPTIVDSGLGYLVGRFGGAGALQALSSPFAALSDLTAGVSLYVVGKRTDAGSGQDGLIWLDDNDGTTGNANQLGLTWNGPGTTATAFAYDNAAGATFDASAADLALNTQAVVSGHITTTAREVRVDGVGSAEGSGTTRDPEDLSRVLIGAYALFSTTQIGYFTGDIARVLVCEPATYAASALAYLQSAHPAS